MKILLSLALIAVLLLFPRSTSQAAVSALRIWGLDVVPSLFPYMVLSRMLATGFRARRIPVDVSAWVLGLMGGSPSGAAVLAAYADEVPNQKLPALCALTGCISPMFLLNTVAGWAKDALFGRLLLASHLIAAVLSYLIIQSFCAETDVPPPRAAGEQSDSDNPIVQSVSAVLNVGGCIIFFSVAAAACAQLLPFLSQPQQAILHGILEVSGGLHAILAAPLPLTFKYALCAGVAGFGGLSILFQNDCFLKPIGVRFSSLLAFGLIRALIASAAMMFMLHVLM